MKKNQYVGEIPEWQIEEVRKRTQRYLDNPTSAVDFETVMKDIEDQL